jgi:hypothetical protein
MDTRRRSHGSAAVAQDRRTVLIVPIGDHALEKVSVSAGWHRLEQVAGNHFTALSGCGHLRRSATVSKNSWVVEQDPVQQRIGSEDCRQQHSLAAADVGEDLNFENS